MNKYLIFLVGDEEVGCAPGDHCDTEFSSNYFIVAYAVSWLIRGCIFAGILLDYFLKIEDPLRLSDNKHIHIDIHKVHKNLCQTFCPLKNEAQRKVLLKQIKKHNVDYILPPDIINYDIGFQFDDQARASLITVLNHGKTQISFKELIKCLQYCKKADKK